MRIAALESQLALATGPVSATEATAPAVATAGTGQAAPTTSFESILAGTVEEANRMDQTAQAKVSALASGAIDDLHGTMISVKQADISIKLVGSIRNKLLDAFNELWRTSV